MSERLIVVDGYNLILRTPALKPEGGRTLRQSREKLVNLLSWGIGGGDARFVVVFDGAESGSNAEGTQRVEVRFSRPPKTADDVIREIVEAEVDRVDRLTVVTSDLEVARHARAMGADIALADLFLASALDPSGSQEVPEKPATISKRELEEWAALFRRGTKPDPEDSQ
ncbi:MAG: NYN domain-containing protein [Candidatus Eiseniibacteriota bacterium]